MKFAIMGLASLAMMSMASTTASADGHSKDGWLTQESAHSVSVTADKLTAAVEKAGAKVFARVDHQAGAKSIGDDLAGATLVIFGNPKIGTPIMKSNIRAGLDLPIRVLIWEEGGKTMLGATDPDVLKERYSVEGADKALMTMKGALGKLMGAAAK